MVSRRLILIRRRWNGEILVGWYFSGRGNADVEGVGVLARRRCQIRHDEERKETEMATRSRTEKITSAILGDRVRWVELTWVGGALFIFLDRWFVFWSVLYASCASRGYLDVWRWSITSGYHRNYRIEAHAMFSRFQRWNFSSLKFNLSSPSRVVWTVARYT